MPSIREQCLQAIAAELETITVEDGYSCDIGSKVYRCRQSIPTASLPAIAVWDGAEVSALRYGAVDCVMDITIVLHALSTERSDAGALIEDIYRCLSYMTTQGTTIQRLTYQSATPRYPVDGSQVLQVESNWQCAYRYQRAEPSSDPQ